MTPKTLPSDSFKIKIQNAKSTHRYLYEVLVKKGFGIGQLDENNKQDWKHVVPKESVYEDYSSWCEKRSEIACSHELFGRALKSLIIIKDVRPTRNSRQRCYEFTSLWQAQEDFCKAFQEKPEDVFYDHAYYWDAFNKNML